MKTAKEFRAQARAALKGCWGIALVAGLLAALLGGLNSGAPSFDLNINIENNALQSIGHSLSALPGFEQIGEHLSNMLPWLVGVGSVFLLIGLVVSVLYFILGSIVQTGYCKFNLSIIDRAQEKSLVSLFDYFRFWKHTALAQLVSFVHILLWSLLFVIPGIMVSYSYAMVFFVLSEDPELSPREALARSKALMAGHRWQLFCLRISFIGWALLCVLTLGIGNLWLTPYQQAAEAAFYREISGTARPAAPVSEFL